MPTNNSTVMIWTCDQQLAPRGLPTPAAVHSRSSGTVRRTAEHGHAETGKRGAVLAEPSPSSALLVVGLSSARGQLPRLVFPPATFGRPGRPTPTSPNLPNGREETRRERDLHEAHDICDMSGPWKTSLRISRLDDSEKVTIHLPLREPPVRLCPSSSTPILR